MPLSIMKLFQAITKILVVGILLHAPIGLKAQTPIVGYNKRTILNGSDTIISIPLHQYPGLFATVSSTSSESNGRVTVEFEITDPLTENELSGSHYVRIVSGPAEGRHFPIVSIGASTISIESNEENQLSSGTKIQISPHWTLSNFFVDHRSEAVHNSGGKLPIQRKTEILFFDTTRDGIELAPDKIFFRTSEGWHQATSGYPAAGDVTIPPGSAFVIRHPSGEADTTLILNSYVNTGIATASLKTSSSGQQDVPLGLPRPVPVKLDELNLSGATAFISSATTAAVDRADELMVFVERELLCKIRRLLHD